MVRYGLVGLPNVGKSTLFNALVRRALADVSNYPFCTVEPNVSVVTVPDERLDALAGVFAQQQVVPTALEVYDIAGLVRDAHKGQGLGNQFLSHIRQVDAILHVVRGFADADISHVEGPPDPARDIDILRTELLLADLGTAERRREKAASEAKAATKEARQALAWIEDLVAHLATGELARDWPAKEPSQVDARSAWLADLFLLTAKPELIVVNIGEDESVGAEAVTAAEAAGGAPVITVPAQIERELAELEPDDAALFRSEYGLEEAALARLIRAGYDLLDLRTFFTGVGRELRAWTLPAGATAAEVAGRIHTDMQQGFVRAEVVPFDVLVKAGSWSAAREKGQVAVQGREYVVQDGDVLQIKFTT